MSKKLENKAEEVLQRYGEEIVKRFQDRLIEGGEHGPKLATGSLIGTMRAEVKTEGGKSILRVYAEPYLRYVDRGRRPGSFPPLSAIKEWTRVKMIPERLAYPIAKKIADEGIKPLNFINPTIDDVTIEFKPEMEEAFADVIGVVLANDVFNQTTTKGRILSKKFR